MREAAAQQLQVEREARRATDADKEKVLQHTRAAMLAEKAALAAHALEAQRELE